MNKIFGGNELHSSEKAVTPMMLMSEVHKMIHNRIREEADEPDLQNSYRPILFHLAHADGISQLELSRLTHLKPPTVSVTLRKMEEDGYVRRETDKSDMRQINVFLTEKGKSHDDRIREIIGRLEEKVMKGITPEESEAFMNVLEKMKNNIRG